MTEEVHYASIHHFVRNRSVDVHPGGVDAAVLYVMMYGVEHTPSELSRFRTCLQRCGWHYSPKTRKWRLPDRVVSARRETDLSEELNILAQRPKAFDPGYTISELWCAIWPGRTCKSHKELLAFTEQVGALGWRRSFNPYWRPKVRPVPSGD